ncbi:hypothetical protein ACP70R_041945 [Stipagrostis hirtigluma subsp. patula]
MSSSSLRFLNKSGGGGGGGRFDGGVALEVTVLSAESLRLPPSYSPLPRRLRPYVTVSSDEADSACSTGVAAGASAGGEHSWGDTLVVPVGAEFLEGRAEVRVAVLSEASCRLVGATPLGWCGIPAADVLDGLRAPRALRRLSYALRCPRRGGGGGAPAWACHAVVHLAVRVLGLRDDDGGPRLAAPAAAAMPAQQQGWCRVAMGIPVSGASAAAAVVGTPWSWGAASR